MTLPDPDPADRHVPLTSRAFRITVDGGRETFDALEIADGRCAEAYLISDTVRSLESMR